MSYFAIISTEDGTYFEEVKDMDKFMSENITDPDLDPASTPKFLDKVPGEFDFNYWPRGILLVKGEIVVPKPVNVVTKYEIP